MDEMMNTNNALLEATKAINGSLDLHVVLQKVAQQAAGVMRAEASSVLLMDERRQKLVFKAAFGCKADQLIDREFDAALGIAGKVARERKSCRITRCEAEESFFKGFDSQLRFNTRNMISSPMIYQDKVVGVIEVLNSLGRDGFAEQDVNLLEIFANLAAIGTVNAERYEGLKRQNEGLRLAENGRGDIIGSRQSLKGVMELVAKVAHTAATVLILGETGTGKELIAKTIHQQSPRVRAPFVAINCGALPEGLLESELFGHEKGSFTGAVEQRLGRFELAEGGTIFLDEVGELSPAIQVKLLRVLQEHEFVRVGGTKTLLAEVRVIAATNRDLQKMMSEGSFREDLYYRLNVFPIHLPPLRERLEDIPELVQYQVKRVAADLKVPVCDVSASAMAMLSAYRWPGNIRELQNVIERAVLLSNGQKIDEADLPKEITGGESAAVTAEKIGGGPMTLPEQEKMLILRCLEKNNWNQSKAARELGITRDHLRYRIKKYDLQK
jgi:Nif-specific regulatory protein